MCGSLWFHSDQCFRQIRPRDAKEQKQCETIIEDCFENNIQILGVSETHHGNRGLEEYKQENRKYSFFYSGKENDSNHGVGIVVEQDLNPTFKQISDRICQAEIRLQKRKLIAISVYAPTLSQSEKQPEVREEFYQQLDAAIKKVPSRDICVVLGDFNAKTGSG